MTDCNWSERFSRSENFDQNRFFGFLKTQGFFLVEKKHTGILLGYCIFHQFTAEIPTLPTFGAVSPSPYFYQNLQIFHTIQQHRGSIYEKSCF